MEFESLRASAAMYWQSNLTLGRCPVTTAYYFFFYPQGKFYPQFFFTLFRSPGPGKRSNMDACLELLALEGT